MIIHAPPVKLLAPFEKDPNGRRLNELLGYQCPKPNRHGWLDLATTRAGVFTFVEHAAMLKELLTLWILLGHRHDLGEI